MFIPQSSITATNYTNGSQLKYSNGLYYIGYYIVTNQNKYYAKIGVDEYSYTQLFGNITSNKTSNLNEYLIQTNDNAIFTAQKNIQPSTLPELSNITVKPTESDYTTGSFIRYFAGLKLSSTPKIYELDITTYNNVNSNYNNSYNTTSLTWLLTGPKNDIYNGNMLVSKGVYDRNLKSIQQASTIIIGLDLFITDYTQWWKPTEENTINNGVSSIINSISNSQPQSQINNNLNKKKIKK